MLDNWHRFKREGGILRLRPTGYRDGTEAEFHVDELFVGSPAPVHREEGKGT